MTIPTIIQKQREKATVTALKKAYATLSQAYTLAVKDNGPFDGWYNWSGENSALGVESKFILDTLAPYLRVSKNCGNTEKGCSPLQKYRVLNGEPDWMPNDYIVSARAILQDGSLISIGRVNSVTKIWAADIDVDINGFKGPNQRGIDSFNFVLYTNKGIVPTGLETHYFAFSRFCADKSVGVREQEGSNGLGCAAWVVFNENMDYLHCSDLAWNGKKKCD